MQAASYMHLATTGYLMYLTTPVEGTHYLSLTPFLGPV